VSQEVNWAERVVRFLSNPVVAPFLMTLGFLGLIVEIKSPSFGLAGIAGVVSLGLFFGSHLIVGLAGMESLLLFGAGILLLGLEVFLVPGVGIFGALGGLGVFAGLYMSLLGGLPTVPDFTRAGMVMTTTILLILVSAWALIRSLPGNRRLTRSGIFLGDRTDRSIGYESSRPREELLGLHGRALTDLRPSGTALVGEERIDVVSESEWIPQGTAVEVVSAEGYRHVVRRVDPA